MCYENAFATAQVLPIYCMRREEEASCVMVERRRLHVL